MRKRNQTTVVLTEIAQPIKDRFAGIYGLKNLLSAGLVLFGKLRTDQQQRAIEEAAGLSATSINPEHIRETISMIKGLTNKPSLSRSEQDLLKRLRNALSAPLIPDAIEPSASSAKSG